MERWQQKQDRSGLKNDCKMAKWRHCGYKALRRNFSVKWNRVMVDS